MNKIIKQLIILFLGRQLTYRIGRSLYLYARAEISNEISTNGERFVQKFVIQGWELSGKKDKNLVIFDIGANIGTWTSSLIDQLHERNINKNVDIYLFEPVPSTAAILRKNLQHETLNLKIEEIGMSACIETKKIYISPESSGTNSLHYDPSRGDQNLVSINLTTVEDYCTHKNIEHIHLLKCDTEGHDMEVIRGTLSILREEKISVIQFEYNHRWIFSGNFLRDVFTTIDTLPYKIAKIYRHELLIFDVWHPELDRFFEGNYVIVHCNALSWFSSRYASFDKFNALSIK